jgi:hypothetical protein
MMKGSPEGYNIETGLAEPDRPSQTALWEALPSHERARAFRDWVARLPKRKGPPIPADALRRENLYD